MDTLQQERRGGVVGLTLAVSLCVTAASVAQPRVNEQAAAVAEFARRVTAYVDLAKKATEGVPPLKRTDDPTEITSREIAMGDAIRAARVGARPGDILTKEAARLFRTIIKRDFRERSKGGQKVMLDDIPHFRPKVNQTYPSEWPLATFPPPLLVAMPPLPAGLEYRLLSDALILRDTKANLIVDFMLDVF